MSIAVAERSLPEQPDENLSVPREEWAERMLAANGLSHVIHDQRTHTEGVFDEPILSAQDPRMENGSINDDEVIDELGIPRVPRTVAEQAKTYRVHDQLKQIYPKILKGFKRGVRSGIAEGFIPDYVEDRLKDLAQTPVRTFAAHAEVEDDHTKMIYDEYDDTFGAADSLTKEHLETRMPHEMVHKLSGGAFMIKQAAFGGLRRVRVGFSKAVSGMEGVYTKQFLTDAVTEHVKVGITYKEFGVVDPNKRTQDDGVYVNIRAMLGEFIDKSQGIVEVSSFTRALFEDNDGPQGAFSDRARLVKQVRKAYGPGALNKLEKLLIAVRSDEDTKVDSIEFRNLADCIVPPVLDDQGNVVKRGFIDTQRIKDLQVS